MSAWECPNCEGGFPEPIKWSGKYVCPWCYEKLAESHNEGAAVIEEAMEPPKLVSSVEKDDGDQPESPIKRLLQ